MPEDAPLSWGDITESAKSPTLIQARLEHEFRVITFDKSHQLKILWLFLLVLVMLVISEYIFQIYLQKGIIDRLLPVVIPIFTFLFGMGVKTETSTTSKK